MFVEQIKIVSFRCYEQKTCFFTDKINIISGPNASGKTSLVEAIGMLGIGKSFRGNLDKELINHNSNFYYLEYLIGNTPTKEVIKIISNGKNKKIEKNDRKYDGLSDFIGDIKVVIFSPEDIYIVKGEPRNRRKFLDLNLSVIDKDYLNTVVYYNRILKERNRLLKNYVDNNENSVLLKVYSEKLIAEGKKIVIAREKFICNLNPYVIENVKTISSGEEWGKLVYNPNVTVENYEKQFNDNHNNDLILKTTTVGPHRDDFEVLINGVNADICGSQGQIKTLALALKLSLVNIVKEKSEKIIIILDDVFSDLDKTRQNDLMRTLDENYQIFITTTSIDNIEEEIINKSNIINIDKGGENNG